MSEETKHFYEFGPFRLDPRKRRLMRDGEPVRLTPKALDLLLVLIEERGRTVEKDELLEKVWAGTVVEENNLNQNITALRKSLGDSRQDSQYIATVPGIGYRFVADVRKVDDEVIPQRHKGEPQRDEKTSGARVFRYALLMVHQRKTTSDGAIDHGLTARESLLRSGTGVLRRRYN
jgi:DNA-binding winged helix-turn-helix (wHTH) protein